MRPSASVWQCASLSEILFLFCRGAQAPWAVQIQGKRIENRCKSTVTCAHSIFSQMKRRRSAELTVTLPTSLCCRSTAARGRQSLCALGGQESSETCMRAGGLALFLPPLDSLLDARIEKREGGIRIQNMAGNRRH